eukprot:281008-Amorphochlora_amoeboformis.AAC.1
MRQRPDLSLQQSLPRPRRYAQAHHHAKHMQGGGMHPQGEEYRFIASGGERRQVTTQREGYGSRNMGMEAYRQLHGLEMGHSEGVGEKGYQGQQMGRQRGGGLHGQ